MRSTCFVILSALTVVGCASSGRAAPEDASNRVTILVANDFASPVTAYAVWPNGRRNRLGEIRPDAARTFETMRAGDEIALGVELTAAPPRGTTGGPTGFQGGAPPRINPEMVMGEGIMISPGEGIEWRITSTGSLVYRRLVPE